ncbi:MAG: tRNA adenosine(34) deaminase TadA [Gemmatimonadota bacterium]|nr:tRNA adenosine(34) deaminase TadA [Gemmatimonadota bacterium]MDQ8166365.1 tRNA adenosine(34) deaminase TadA [Gemmatimonadota bacterium]
MADAMRAALEEAREAALAGEVPVGAVVLRGTTIVARAQNRMVRDHDGTSHAELLALRAAAALLGEARLSDCTLVVTLEPCAMCAGAIVLARVGSLVFGAWDDKAGMCGSVGDLVRHARLNHRPEVRGGLLADDSAQLLRTFFADRRDASAAPVLNVGEMPTDSRVHGR